MDEDRFEPFHPLPALLGVLSAIAVCLAIACSALGASDAGAPCAAPSAGAAGCVLPLLAKSVSVSQPWGAALDAAGKTCGVSPDAVSSLWASHVQAEVIEGFVPRAVGGDGGVKPSP